MGNSEHANAIYGVPPQLRILTTPCAFDRHRRESGARLGPSTTPRRQAWIGWLFEARQRFGLCVFDYMVTSNHIHLLVDDWKGRELIPQSIRLTAGRSRQEYND